MYVAWTGWNTPHEQTMTNNIIFREGYGSWKAGGQEAFLEKSYPSQSDLYHPYYKSQVKYLALVCIWYATKSF